MFRKIADVQREKELDKLRKNDVLLDDNHPVRKLISRFRKMTDKGTMQQQLQQANGLQGIDPERVPLTNELSAAGTGSCGTPTSDIINLVSSGGGQNGTSTTTISAACDLLSIALTHDVSSDSLAKELPSVSADKNASSGRLMTETTSNSSSNNLLSDSLGLPEAKLENNNVKPRPASKWGRLMKAKPPVVKIDMKTSSSAAAIGDGDASNISFSSKLCDNSDASSIGSNCISVPSIPPSQSLKNLRAPPNDSVSDTSPANTCPILTTTAAVAARRPSSVVNPMTSVAANAGSGAAGFQFVDPVAKQQLLDSMSDIRAEFKEQINELAGRMSRIDDTLKELLQMMAMQQSLALHTACSSCCVSSAPAHSRPRSAGMYFSADSDVTSLASPQPVQRVSGGGGGGSAMGFSSKLLKPSQPSQKTNEFSLLNEVPRWPTLNLLRKSSAVAKSAEIRGASARDSDPDVLSTSNSPMPIFRVLSASLQNTADNMTLLRNETAPHSSSNPGSKIVDKIATRMSKASSLGAYIDGAFNRRTSAEVSGTGSLTNEMRLLSSHGEMPRDVDDDSCEYATKL